MTERTHETLFNLSLDLPGGEGLANEVLAHASAWQIEVDELRAEIQKLKEANAIYFADTLESKNIS